LAFLDAPRIGGQSLRALWLERHVAGCAGVAMADREAWE
jgi:hypothetical protein